MVDFSDQHESQVESTTQRPELVRELDEVIAETEEVIQDDVRQIERLARKMLDDSVTYRSSVQLRNRFSEGGKREARFLDEIRIVSRLLAELTRPDDMPSSHQYARGPRTTKAPALTDRLAQVDRILRANPKPMDAGDIAAAMTLRGWLSDVADPRATVSAALSRGRRLGVFDRVSRGRYQLAGRAEQQGREPDGGV